MGGSAPTTTQLATDKHAICRQKGNALPAEQGKACLNNCWLRSKASPSIAKESRRHVSTAETRRLIAMSPRRYIRYGPEPKSRETKAVKRPLFAPTQALVLHNRGIVISARDLPLYFVRRVSKQATCWMLILRAVSRATRTRAKMSGNSSPKRLIALGEIRYNAEGHSEALL
jgi:hypothetical protein